MLQPEFDKLREEQRYQAGMILSKNRYPAETPLAEVGFRVYSQSSEDGVIQHLIRHVPIENEFFVEFGVEDYSESNTRFLLEHNDWRGLILDMEDSADAFLRSRNLHLLHTIDFRKAAISAENVEQVLADVPADLGLLSIDIDGMDYWVWNAIEALKPAIVVIEYQSHFGPELPLTPPYDPQFSRFKYHYSGLCFGASISALEHLGRQKGYDLIGAARWHNAYFVRSDLRGGLPVQSASETWFDVRYRDSRDRNFQHTKLTTLHEKWSEMRDAKLMHVISGEVKSVGDWFNL
jgi:hypothetical protein